MLQCTQCGQQAPEEAAHCPHCGLRLPPAPAPAMTAPLDAVSPFHAATSPAMTAPHDAVSPFHAAASPAMTAPLDAVSPFHAATSPAMTAPLDAVSPFPAAPPPAMTAPLDAISPFHAAPPPAPPQRLELAAVTPRESAPGKPALSATAALAPRDPLADAVGTLEVPFQRVAPPAPVAPPAMRNATLVGGSPPAPGPVEPPVERTPPNAWASPPARAGAETMVGYAAPTRPEAGPRPAAQTLLGHRSPNLESAPASTPPRGPRGASPKLVSAPAPASPRQPAPAQPARAAAPAPEPKGAARAPANGYDWQKERLKRRRDPLQRRGVFPANAVKARGGSRWSNALLVTALVGLLAALGVVLFIGSQKQVEAEITVASGREVLELHCERCSDGDRVRLGDREGVFRGHSATIPLTERLPIGLNRLEPRLLNGQLFGDQKLQLDVPLHFRLEAQTSELEGDVPKLPVLVETLDDTEVEIEGQKISISNGRGRYEVEVHKDLEGPSAAKETFTKSLVYSVRPRHGRVHSGRLQVEYTALPLVVEAPGPMVVVDSNHFTLAGRSLPGATLELDGRPLPVDAEGDFAQLLNIDSVGETVIWLSASAPGLATRRYPIKVRRVENLGAEAARFAETASANFARIAHDANDERGLAVAFEGTLRDVRQLGYSSKALLDVTAGCSGRCSVQLRLGSRLKLGENTPVVAYGHVAGETTGPNGAALPEIQTLYVLRKR